MIVRENSSAVIVVGYFTSTPPEKTTQFQITDHNRLISIQMKKVYIMIHLIYSPSINDTFQEASKVCVLAETFDLTWFHKYQKIVIDSTLEGRIH